MQKSASTNYSAQKRANSPNCLPALPSHTGIDSLVDAKGNSEMEEATLRAKIQAMKNLLQAKRQRADGAAAVASTSAPARYVHKAPHVGHYPSRTYTRPMPVNRSWNRFSPSTAVETLRDVSTGSANKVWRRDDAARATTAAAAIPVTAGEQASAVGLGRKDRTSSRPVSKVATRRCFLCCCCCCCC